ncbi:hypothetical protein SAVERM_1276 [Streptomyces avermitilis MA-4680 = NBRC 14893]|uniref:Uncharacterized protein n=1 Tax=Streptomyces avermitilis (strain ATCC 31267 / DSM 46492 / JCM 5070 / NBRC 14893 / NCIMB 12804 / NRRL 8165 / MA-4680) TaxID=227882 RepID=Q82NM6_STRAW|nr:hypothetical protein SAVERM_1276 [Streptomyces avermitilis MA-4680 = NBRC 14893]
MRPRPPGTPGGFGEAVTFGRWCGAHTALALTVTEDAFAAVRSGPRRRGRLSPGHPAGARHDQVPIFDTVLGGTSALGPVAATRQELRRSSGRSRRAVPGRSVSGGRSPPSPRCPTMC